jgi:hypothetical protein
VEQLKGLAAGTIGGLLLAAAAITGITPAQASDNPACGYDVYRKALTVTSLSARGTVRVIKWRDDIGTLVRTSKIKPGQTVEFRLKRKASADQFTVDIVKGGLTKEDTPNGHRKVSRCEMA